MARASIQERTAYLSTDFGEQYARRIFGDDVVNGLPRYVRGNRKGLLKGQIRWRRVTKGGWVSTYGGTDGNDYAGYVESRVGTTIEAWLEIRPWGANEPDTIAHWQA